MFKLFDRVKVNIATTGTGDVTFGSASSNAFLTPSDAGAGDGDTVRYCIVDGTDFEVGIGTIKSSVAAMERTSVRESKIGGTAGTTKLNLSGAAVLSLTLAAADIAIPANNLSDLEDPDEALDNLGGTTVGKALFTAADAAAARTAIAIDASRSVVGLIGQRNASTATRLDLAANRVAFKTSAGGVAVEESISSLACDISTSGPAVGGRDQSGAFSSGQTVRFYFIRKDDGTKDLIASSSTTGPTLPSGYTSWAYATTIMMTGSNVQNVWVRGASVYYKAAVIAVTHSSTMPTTSSPVVLSSYVPIDALTVKMQAQMDNATANTGSYTMTIGTDGVAPITFYLGVSSSGATSATGGPFEIPIVSQTVNYQGQSSLTRGGLDILGYTVPNGDG